MLVQLVDLPSNIDPFLRMEKKQFLAFWDHAETFEDLRSRQRRQVERIKHLPTISVKMIAGISCLQKEGCLKMAQDCSGVRWLGRVFQKGNCSCNMLQGSS